MDTAKFNLGLGIVEHTPALRRYAYLLTRNADQADDLLQDCMARALSREHLYQPGTNLRAWLFTMLRNIFMTQCRKSNLRRDYAAKLALKGSETTPANQFHTVALKENLRLMGKLSAGERQAVALLGILDMTYDEAALHSGVKIGTLKSRLSRGRAHLTSLSEPAALR